MSSVAIITARGGSKRIPGKNIRDFLGKPIIAYSIEAALESGIFEEVMVSTDSGEIAEVARRYGANVPFMRSAATSDDFATTKDVLGEVLDNYRSAGREFDYMCCIYPTAPFVTPAKLKVAMKLMESGDYDEVTPVVPFSFPPQRSFVINEGRLIWKWPEFSTARSQDLEKFYHDAGQFYIFRVSTFSNGKEGAVPVKVPFILPETEVQDIDNYDDWEIAEIKYRAMMKKQS